jgi:hypothetical protein
VKNWGAWARTFGAPPDTPALVAVVLAVVLLWQGRRLLVALLEAPRVALLAGLAIGALALSALYIEHYLRGGPRIIDATSYWLQARALAEHQVTWPIAEPTASIRGRFLLMTGPESARRIGVIFPPGYPLVLALGFVLGSPLAVGPVLAALLVMATYALGSSATGREDVARVAACLSVACAAVRYHTADTMSHGLAALLLTGTLWLAFRARDAEGALPRTFSALGAGLAFGWLFATRPVSALAVGPVLAIASWDLVARRRLLLVAGALAPVALFLVEQRAATGAFFRSSQSDYYALSDGPPGCFRYGFGKGIGCLHEHGDYVMNTLRAGLDGHAALLTTGRRLWLHVIDIANAEPLALLVPAGVFLGRRERRVQLLGASVVLLMAAYAPFYFDGSYPGGGARLFADVLPAEHVLVAAGAVLGTEAAAPRVGAWLDIPRGASLVLALSLAAFGLHTVFLHASLRDRDGGRPFFEPQVLAKAHVDHGLLFTGTDHAFNLAYDPRAHDASKELVVAREYGDDRDRLVWERLGRPPAYRYVFDGSRTENPAIVPWSPGPEPRPLRYEAEAEWPPLEQTGGFFEAVHASGTCAWGGRLLTVHIAPDHAFHGIISFPVPRAGRYRIGVHLASRGDVRGRIAVLHNADDPPVTTWGFHWDHQELACTTLPLAEAMLSDHGLIEVSVSGKELSLDAVALEPVESGP